MGGTTVHPGDPPHRPAARAGAHPHALLIFLLMAAAPSVLLLAVGSDLLRQTVDRWFNVDVERLLASSQALGAALDASATEASRVHARLIAREIDARGLLLDEDQVRLRRTIEARSRERDLDLVTVYGRSGEIVSVMDPRAAARRCRGTPSGAALADAVSRDGERSAMIASGAGRLAGSPSRSTARRPARPGRSSCRLHGAGGGLGRPRGARALHEVPQDPDLPRADPRVLPLALSLPGAAAPVRRRLARALPRAAHHDAAAAGRGRRRADRRRRARHPGGLLVRAATSSAR